MEGRVLDIDPCDFTVFNWKRTHENINMRAPKLIRFLSSFFKSNLCLHYFLQHVRNLLLKPIFSNMFLRSQMRPIFSCCTRPSVKPQAALEVAARLLKDEDRFVRARACATLGRCVELTPEMVELLCLGRFRLCKGNLPQLGPETIRWRLTLSYGGFPNGKLGTIKIDCILMTMMLQ